MKRGVSDETLNRMLKASYRHAALAYGTRDEEQIQRQLDDIAARAAAIEPREPEPAIPPSAGRRITVGTLASRCALGWPLLVMGLASTAMLVALSFTPWRDFGVATLVSTQVGVMITLRLAAGWLRNSATRASREGISSSTGETRSRRTRSRA